MNQGVKKNLKVHYQKQVVLKVLSVTDNNPYKGNNKITMKGCIAEVSKARVNDINSKTIVQCFSKAGFTNIFKQKKLHTR